MCAICGFFKNNSLNNSNLDILRAMMSAQVHRGPDDDGVYSDNSIHLGFKRLSIIGIENGHQPIFNEDKSVVIICNGEIYNYQDLRDKLIKKGHSFSTRSDCEVIVHLYEEHGLDFVSKLEGMFSICLWNIAEKQLVLARDRMGIKPLYYYRHNTHFAFASELKSLIKFPLIKKEVNPHALGAYFSLNYIPYPSTIYKNIYKLAPGTVLVHDKNGVELKPYWNIRKKLPSTRIMDQSKWITSLRDAFWDAVKKRLMSDVPLGVLLSGGIDSSGIVAALFMLGETKIPTFSVIFKDLPGYDEGEYSRFVADYFKTNHTVLDVKSDCLHMLEKVIYQMDEPIADKALIPSYLIFGEASKHVKVILSGEGADELFLGYNKYKWLNMLPSGRVPLARSAKGLVRSSRRIYKLMDFLAKPSSLEKAVLWDRVFLEEEKERLLKNFHEYTYSSNSCAIPPLRKNSLIEFMAVWDLLYYLPENLLMKVDKLSMAHGLEARVPYLDWRFVKLLMRVPLKLKLNQSASKYVLRKMFTGILPDKILNRPKHGFTLPVKEWIRHDKSGLIDKYLDGKILRESKYLDENRVRTILSAHRLGKADYTRQIWNILTWQIWAYQNGF